MQATPNKPTRRMLNWLVRRSSAPPFRQPSSVRQRLQAARHLVQRQKETDAPSEFSKKPLPRSFGREIAPLTASDEPILYLPPPPPPGPPALAAALESILQGRKVSPDIFTQLYRGGFVFKDPHGQWAITEMGKELIERNKLFTPGLCLVAGVKCASDWNA